MQKKLYEELANYIQELLQQKNSRPEPEVVSQLFKELRLLKSIS